MNKDKIKYMIRQFFDKLKRKAEDSYPIVINYMDKRTLRRSPLSVAKKGDACIDLTCEGFKIDPKNNRLVSYYTGLYFEIPEGYEMEIRPRSSIKNYDLILVNSPATIDSGYRGEIILNFLMTTSPDVARIYEEGDRIAQFKINKVNSVLLNQKNELSSSERGNTGFGSSGK